MTKQTLLVLILIMSAGCSFRPVLPHNGDGKFTNTTQVAPLVRIPGYAVRFEPFDLSRDYSKSYSVDSLPALKNDAFVELHLNDFDKFKWEEMINASTARLSVSIANTDGDQLLRFNTSLSKMIWGRDGADDVVYGYDITNGRFQPAPGDKLQITLNYTGDKSLGGNTGLLELDCGGSL